MNHQLIKYLSQLVAAALCRPPVIRLLRVWQQISILHPVPVLNLPQELLLLTGPLLQ